MDDAFTAPPVSQLKGQPFTRVETAVPAEETDPVSIAPHSLNARVHSLSNALRRARLENAEQSSALTDLRLAEVARLEIMRDALNPLIAQLPPECDMFDIAISPGEHPRLFIDHLGFIHMDRDRRGYCFMQDTRHGRIKLAQTDKVEDMVDAVTNYVAHRLIEREKALAADYASGGPAQIIVEKRKASRAPHSTITILWRGYRYFCELIGVLCFIGLLIIIGQWFYQASIAPL